jgi:hypothetical protein
MRIHQLLETPIEPTGDPNDPTVYGHQKANPMSLKGRIVQARNQLKELAELAESDELVVWERITRLSQGGMFMGLEQNLEQIRHGIEELAMRRKKGGPGSRGIDKNIGEALANPDVKCARCGTPYSKHFRFDPEGDANGKIVGTKIRGLCGNVPEDFPGLK